jgi:hypothetical protein
MPAARKTEFINFKPNISPFKIKGLTPLLLFFYPFVGKPLVNKRGPVAFIIERSSSITISSTFELRRITMKRLIKNTTRQSRNKSLLTWVLKVNRNWLRCGLLIPILAVTSVSHAATIHDAAKSGDLAQVQRLIVDGADVNERAVREETPIMIATLAGQGEIVNYLLQRGADIDARNASGLSTLHAAAYSGQTDIVKLLVAKGAKVNDAANRFKVTPLHLASEENHIAIVQVLLKQDADSSVVEFNNFTAMTRAGFREHWDVVNVLLANGATCQKEEVVGDWLYQECTTRANAN